MTIPSEATEGSRRFVAFPATSANGHAAGTVNARRAHAIGVGRWRDPSHAELSRSKLAVRASAVSLTVIVVSCLLLVSLASARWSFLVPVSKPGFYPSWIAGPTGALTSWMNASSHTERVLLTVLLPAMLVAYLVVAYSARWLRASWVLGAIVALHVIFLLSPPLTLTDVFNYLNYGRMEMVHHLNPYTTIPALEPHTDPTFGLSNWHGLLSPYGPLFTLFTMALAPLGVSAAFWAIKAALMLASLGTIALTYRCAALLGRDPLTAAVIVGMNPIVLVWGLGGDHNDFFMLMFLALGFWLLLRAQAMRVGKRSHPPAAARHGVPAAARRAWAWLDGMPRPLVVGEPWPWMEVGAGVALVAAVAVKSSAAVVLPVVLAGAARRTRVAAGLVIGAAAAAAMTYAAFGFNLPDLGQQTQLVVSVGIPNLTGLALGLGGATPEMRKVLELILIGVIVLATLWCWRSRRWLTGAGWVTFTLILTLSWTLPWYIVWVLPFCALARSRALRLGAVLLGLYIYLAFMPYSPQILSFLHVSPSTTNVGQQEQTFMNSLLF